MCLERRRAKLRGLLIKSQLSRASQVRLREVKGAELHVEPKRPETLLGIRSQRQLLMVAALWWPRLRTRQLLPARTKAALRHRLWFLKGFSVSKLIGPDQRNALRGYRVNHLVT